MSEVGTKVSLRLLRRTLPDVRLIQAAGDGCQHAYEALVHRYQPRLYRVAFNVLRDRGEAQDAVQEAYFRAFTRLGSYAPTASFGDWLSRITRNEALMLLRKRHLRTITLEPADLESLGGTCASAEERTVAAGTVGPRRARQLLERVGDSLPPDLRNVFVLRRIDDLSVRETARSLGVNEITVRTRLHRAQQLLKTGKTPSIRHLRGQIFEYCGLG